MMMRTINARQPALTRQEAALLTALPRTPGRGSSRGMNLLMPGEGQGFIPVSQPVEALQPAGSVNNADVSSYIFGSILAMSREDVILSAVLSAAGISMPGVMGMRRGCRRAQDRQATLYCCEVVQDYELL